MSSGPALLHHERLWAKKLNRHLIVQGLVRFLGSSNRCDANFANAVLSTEGCR